MKQKTRKMSLIRVGAIFITTMLSVFSLVSPASQCINFYQKTTAEEIESVSDGLRRQFKNSQNSVHPILKIFFENAPYDIRQRDQVTEWRRDNLKKYFQIDKAINRNEVTGEFPTFTREGKQALPGERGYTLFEIALGLKDEALLARAIALIPRDKIEAYLPKTKYGRWEYRAIDKLFPNIELLGSEPGKIYSLTLVPATFVNYEMARVILSSFLNDKKYRNTRAELANGGEKARKQHADSLKQVQAVNDRYDRDLENKANEEYNSRSDADGSWRRGMDWYAR